MDDEMIRYRADQAHAYLERIRQAGEDCAGLQAQIEDAYSRASGVRGIDYSEVRVKVSPTADAIPDAVGRIVDKVREYAADLAAYEDDRHAAHRALSLMDNQADAKALRLRYLLNWKWERICGEMDYSWDGMMTLRKRALASYYEVMPPAGRDPMHPAV